MPKRTHCAYCGCQLARLKPEDRTNDHVPPKGIFPASLAHSRVQRLTVPACRSCHSAFSDDDATFRNILPLCGQVPPLLMRELWDDAVMRGLSQKDGERRTKDLLRLMRPDENGLTRIWPEESPAFMRVLRRIVRALCWHHDVGWPVPDQSIHVERLRYLIPPGLIDELPGGQSAGGIFKWIFVSRPEDGEGAASVLMIFRDNVRFLGIVSPKSPQ